MRNEEFMKKLKIILLIIVLLIIFPIGFNKLFKTDYSSLSENNKQILSEYDKFYAKNPNLWNNYDLNKKTIVVLDKNFMGDLFIINPQKEIRSLFATRIKLPDSYKIKVYRVSKNYPKRMQYIMGNFNTKDKVYNILGEKNIFYVKTDEDSLAPKFNSKRFVPFLSHEAFHYYMQQNWTDLTFRGMSYSDSEIALLDEEYKILDKIKDEVEKATSDKDLLDSHLKEYVSIMKKRKENTDKEKLKAELAEETIEGTAQYVGIKSAKSVDYDLGILYFINTNKVKFSEIVPTMKQGKVDQSIIGSHIVYDSGALLCFAMDKLDFLDWQQTLIEKNNNSIYTINDLIEDHYNQSK